MGTGPLPELSPHPAPNGWGSEDRSAGKGVNGVLPSPRAHANALDRPGLRLIDGIPGAEF